jgi:calcineurin-like phosphoesterase family protein
LSTYLTADWHLDHWAAWLQKQRHEFHSVGEMNSVLLANALETVRPTDELYVLGDFAFKPETFKAYAAALESACTVHWVKGNHDPKVRHDPLMLDFRHNKRHYYVAHYPLQSWRPNTVMIHGHSHGNPLAFPEDSRLQWRFDVGVDTEWSGRKYFPVSTDQIEAAMVEGVHPCR